MLASTNIIHNRVVVSAMRLLLGIIRTLPTLVSALIATYVFGLGTLAGTTAIAIFTFAYIGKIPVSYTHLIAATSLTLPLSTTSENTMLFSFGPSSPSSVTARVARPIRIRSAVCRHSAI